MNATSLPDHLIDGGIELRVNTRALWPHVRRITERDRSFLIKSYKWNTEFASGLTDREMYNTHFVQRIQEIGNKTQSRWYWMYSPARKCLTGDLVALTPKQYPNVMAVGFLVFPTQREHGFAALAAQAVAVYALRQNMATYICTETRLDNHTSINSLLRAGFKDMGTGLSTLSTAKEHSVSRRFMRTKDPALGTWPIPEPTS